MKNSSDPLAGSLFKRHSLGDLWASQEEKRRRTTAKISRRHLIELPEEQKELEDVRMDLSFSGAGFMGEYLLRAGRLRKSFEAPLRTAATNRTA